MGIAEVDAAATEVVRMAEQSEELVQLAVAQVIVQFPFYEAIQPLGQARLQ